MASITITRRTEDGAFGTMAWDGGQSAGPLPPGDAEMRAVYDRLIAEGVVPTDAPPPPPPPVVPETISDRQFAQALALAGTITEDEALAWAARGDLPKAMADAVQKIPEAGKQRFGAKMLLTSATTYERSHPLTPQLGALLGYDAAALDALWTRAAAL